MIQGGSSTSLTAETLEGLRVAHELIGEELESDEAAELGVLGLVNHTHAATAEFFDDAVVGNGLADE
jgi:hypothetical protein